MKLVFAFICLFTFSSLANAMLYEGYGAVTTGGAGGEICRVTNLSNSGTGSLRDCVSNRNIVGGSYIPRTIVFDIGGEIRLLSDLHINTPHMTIDGFTAPSPGITIRKISFTDGEVVITTSGPSAGHDIIIRYLRFDGEWGLITDPSANNTGTLAIDGEDDPGEVYNIIFDHISIERATDSGGDVWGDVRNLTIQWSMFYNSVHPMSISHSGGSQARRNISLHHNVFAYNHERNPQIRGNVHHFNFVNNVIYNWNRFGFGYGVRLRERNGVFPTDINVINNFFSSQQHKNRAFILGASPGDAPIPYPGDVYLSGNYFPAENVDSLGTVSNPIPTPQGSEVTTHALSQLTTAMLPSVGTHYRTVEEQQILGEIEISINDVVTPTPTEACSDGLDNDGDNLTDYPNDPGCASATDNDEFDGGTPPPTFQCSDGIDNDGDNLTDYPNDPGCASAEDNDELDPSSTSDLLVSNMTTASGRTYEVVTNGLVNNALSYIDRTYTFSSIPSTLAGKTYIKTANADKGFTGNNFLTFNVNQDVTLYVAHDKRNTAKPSWMQTFTPTGASLVTTDTTLDLFVKDFSQGEIILGGSSSSSMYSVVIVGQGGGTTPPPPTYQCSDGVDNDGDLLTDYPSDPGCIDSNDNDESNAPPAAPTNLNIQVNP